LCIACNAQPQSPKFKGETCLAMRRPCMLHMLNWHAGRCLVSRVVRSIRVAGPLLCFCGRTTFVRYPTRMSPNQRLCGGSADCDASSARTRSSHSCNTPLRCNSAACNPHDATSSIQRAACNVGATCTIHRRQCTLCYKWQCLLDTFILQALTSSCPLVDVPAPATEVGAGTESAAN
jgi:hypothetical protein